MFVNFRTLPFSKIWKLGDGEAFCSPNTVPSEDDNTVFHRYSILSALNLGQEVCFSQDHLVKIKGKSLAKESNAATTFKKQ